MKFRIGFGAVAICLASLLPLANPADASEVSVCLHGPVRTDLPISPELQSLFSHGDSIEMEATYETAATDQVPSIPEWAYYFDSVRSGRLRVLGSNGAVKYEASGTSGYVEVENERGGPGNRDYLFVPLSSTSFGGNLTGSSAPPGLTLESIFFELGDNDGLAVDSDAIPAIFTLQDFDDHHQVQLRFRTSGGYSTLVNTIEPVVTPGLCSPASPTTLTVEFEGTVFFVHSDITSVFTNGQTIRGSYTQTGIPQNPDVSYRLLSFNISSPTYAANATPAVLGPRDVVSFVDDRDYGNPLIDVEDLYFAGVHAFTSAPSVNGLTLESAQVRLDKRGAPPQDLWSNTDLVFAPPSLTAGLTTNFGALTFEGIRHVLFTVTLLRSGATDSDADGAPEATDNCPGVANPDQIDSDRDGIGDACDTDSDNDNVLDDIDNCEFTANPDQADLDVDGLGNACDSDPDGDQILSSADNCPLVPNVDQVDIDADAVGDDCDADDDNDAICDIGAAGDGCAAGPDNCSVVPNLAQEDLDFDAIGDACDSDLDGDGTINEADNCPVDVNVDQNDTDQDGAGDACDEDLDNDSVGNGLDNCPYISNLNQTDLDSDGLGDACDADIDGDGVASVADNCPAMPNSDQRDIDDDLLGDACDPDIDNDAVLNGNDECAATPVGTVVDAANGCSIAQLCPCEGPAGTVVPWRNHGKYVSCIAHVSNDFVAKSLLTAAEKDAVQSAAATFSCGK